MEYKKVVYGKEMHIIISVSKTEKWFQKWEMIKFCVLMWQMIQEFESISHPLIFDFNKYKMQIMNVAGCFCFR